MEKDIMNLEEAAQYLGVSKGWLTRACNEGKVPHTRFGKKYVFHKSTLDEWMKKITQSMEQIKLTPYQPKGTGRRGRPKKEESKKAEKEEKKE